MTLSAKEISGLLDQYLSAERRKADVEAMIVDASQAVEDARNALIGRLASEYKGRVGVVRKPIVVHGHLVTFVRDEGGNSSVTVLPVELLE
jgi:hypothetical protein